MQKEALSALMDGESVNKELINQMNKDADLREVWQRYHLIRDSLRGEVAEYIQVDIADRVAAQLEAEPEYGTYVDSIVEDQPHPSEFKRFGFLDKLKPLTANFLQFGLAASVALALVVGVQSYNKTEQQDIVNYADNPVFNTLPIFGEATPVSFGVPNNAKSQNLSKSHQQLQEQRQRVNALLQDYDLQKRLTKTQNGSDKSTTQVGLSVPGEQNLGTENIRTQ